MHAVHIAFVHVYCQHQQVMQWHSARIGVCFKMYNVLPETKFVNHNIKIADAFIMTYSVIYIHITAIQQ